MAQTILVTLGGTGTVNAEDSAATPSTVAQRDSSGNLFGARMQGSELKSTGALTLPVSASKTTSFTADATVVFYRCDATSGAIVATLPAAAGVTGRVYWFKKTDSGGNTVTVTASGAETIDGANTKVLSTQYAKTCIICDGTSWHILV